MADEIKIDPKDLPFNPNDEPASEENNYGVITETKVQQKPTLTPEQEAEVARLAELDKKYGSQEVQTFLEGLARSASFGLSDVILGNILGKRAVAGRKEANETAALTGELTGIVAPTIASGGTSLAAKGAQKAGAGVLGAAKLGKIAEKGTSALLKELSKDSIKARILEKSISQAVGSGVEASLYGAGQLVSEAALGKADFNAENLLSYTGTAAAFGGVTGGIFGATEALVPVIKNNKVTDFITKKLPKGDVKEESINLVTDTISQRIYMKQNAGDVVENLPNFLGNELKMAVVGKGPKSAKELLDANTAAQPKIAKKIGETVKTLDKQAKNQGMFVSGEKIARDIANKIYKQADKFRRGASAASKKIADALDQEAEAVLAWGAKNAKVGIKGLQDQKIIADKTANFVKEFQKMNPAEKANIITANSFRDAMYEFAEQINPALQKQLRQHNTNYRTSLIIGKNLAKKADKEANKAFLGLKDLVLAGSIGALAGETTIGDPSLGALAIIAKKYANSDLRRRAVVLKGMEKGNRRVQSAISDSIKNFFTKAKKVAVPTSTKIMLNTSFNIEGKKPKDANKKQAFKRISQELTELNTNPEKLIRHLAKNNLRVTDTAPETADQVNQTMVRAVSFLYDKLPKSASQKGMIQNLRKNKTFEPSTIDISKFERYLEGVDRPLSLLEDLESGRLSREKIEAVKNVYPNLYARIQDQAMEYITENADDISYPKRLQLGILLGVPADTSLIPENLQNLQETFIMEQEEQAAEQGAVSPTQGGLNNITISDSAKSATERVSTRE